MMQQYTKDNFQVIYAPCDDLKTPSNKNDFEKLVNDIEKHLQDGRNVVLHCHAGIGRTGLTICCLAKRFLGMGSDESIGWIRNLVPGAVQTTVQENFVKAF